MYEVFITAFLNDVDFQTARSLLSGYCDDQPHPRIYRVLSFAGTSPNQPKGLTKKNNIHGIPPEPDIFSLGLPGAEPAPDPSARYFDPSWNELNDVLKKSTSLHSMLDLVVNQTLTPPQTILHRQRPLRSPQKPSLWLL